MLQAEALPQEEALRAKALPQEEVLQAQPPGPERQPGPEQQRARAQRAWLQRAGPTAH